MPEIMSENISSSIQNKQNELDSITENVEQKKSELDNLYLLISNNNSEVTSLAQKIDDLNNEISKLKIEIESLTKDYQIKSEEIEAISDNLSLKNTQSETITLSISTKENELSALNTTIAELDADIKNKNIEIHTLLERINELEKNVGLYENNLEGISKHNKKIKKTYSVYSIATIILIVLISSFALLTILLPEIFSSGMIDFGENSEYLAGLKTHNYLSAVIFKLPILTILLFVIYAFFKLFKGFISLNITANKQMSGLYNIIFILKQIRDSKNITGLTASQIIDNENRILSDQYKLISQYIEGLIKQNNDQFSELSNVKHPLEQTKEIIESILKNSPELVKSIKEVIK